MPTKKAPPPRPIGRPSTLKDGGRRTLYLDNQTWEAAAKIGNGNASEGIRAAIAAYKPKPKAKQVKQ